MSVRHFLTVVAAVSAVAVAGCTPTSQSTPSAGASGAAASSDESQEASPEPSVDPSQAEAADPAAAPARKALDTHGGDVRATPEDRFAFYGSRVDGAGGGSHVRFTRTYRGLRVYGGDIVVHTGPGGTYKGASNSLVKPLQVDVTPKISATDALAAAKAHFTGKVAGAGAPRLLVDASTGTGRLTWESVVEGVAKDGQTPSRLHVLTDAHTGGVVRSWDEVETIAGTGNSLYSGKVSIDTQRFGTTFRLTDTTRGRGTVCDMAHQEDENGSCKLFTDADNTWGTGTNDDPASAAVDAAYGAATTYDYFKTVHGRRGINNNGRGVPSRVHFGDEYVNAFWDKGRMTYGDGRGNAHPLVQLDIAGHEMSHGITEKSVSGDLTYTGESGGLNEATSDIFGNMVEFYAANPADPGDYLIGEKIDIFGNGTPLRYMFDPALDGRSHSCWSAETPNVDPHLSSGVGNHFYFNLAEGTGKTAFGTSPICGNAGAVTGIGRAKAEKIWYRALDVYFISNTSYVSTENPGNTARAYTLQAAADLYGSCGAEYKAVQLAWTAVNVAGTDAACA
ncbi:M4 family metallopeptidase [Dactylosporangium sp. NPDC006015]|uniref:M4 family metallopeptidase n=1 Tax=Dactylosporangium sp. NPDC006015 TaxID=3154576 RepID=UPI0033B32D60